MYDGQFYPGQPIQFMEGALTPLIGGLQYRTDFSEYTVGAQPSDWTQRWATTGYTTLVQNASGSLGGKALRFTKTALAGRALITWNRISSIGDCEILMRARVIENLVSGDPCVRPSSRAGGTAGAETCYFANWTGGAALTTYNYSIGKYNSGASTVLGSTLAVSGLTAQAWQWHRFKVSSTSIIYTTWQDGASEGAPISSQTDTDLISGLVGITTVQNNPDCEVDFFSVGLSGMRAPS